MCLRKVDPKVPINGFAPRIVWKMFYQSSQSPDTLRGYYRLTTHTIGIPKLCHSRRILGDNNAQYRSGFHGYASKDAIWPQSRCSYYPCLLEKIHTRGSEIANGCSRSVYVGKKLTIYRTIEEAQAALKNLRATTKKKKPA